MTVQKPACHIPSSPTHLVEALALQTASGDSEVDKCDSRADVRWEFHVGVTGGKEDGEGGGQVNVLVTQGDQHSASSAAQLPVQHRIQDGVITLHILDTLEK